MHLAQANYSANKIKVAALKISDGENQHALSGLFKSMLHPNGYKTIWM